ncbi:MAG: serine hydrolase domain-containing protein [Pseudomonadota bacterium]
MTMPSRRWTPRHAPAHYLALTLLACCVSACAPSPPDAAVARGEGAATDDTPVDTAIDEAVARGAFPFLYVRVETLGGDVVYEHSAINERFTTRTPDGESWLRLWSMSKSVTIATILSLEEDGVLSRSDPVVDYIPEFNALRVLSADADAPSCDEGQRPPKRAITMEDLLNHNDGFYYPFTAYPCLNQAMNRARLPEASSTDQLIERIAKLPLHPGGVGDHQYGIGTTVLGLVAERATGQSFDQVVRERITGPLGIDDVLRYMLPPNEPTYARVTGEDGTLRFADDDDLDIFGGPVPEYRPDTAIFLGGEGMVGTTQGFATFLRAMGNHGELNGTRILRDATVRDWYAPKTQLDSPYGRNGFNIWVTSGKFDNLPDQKPGLLVGGGYEGTAFWIDLDAGLVGLIMSQVHQPATKGVDEVSKIRGLLYEHVLEPESVH